MLSPNTLLHDRYLVLRLLGQGGMGAVYQATDRKFGNAVAVKETFYNDTPLQHAFSQEARLLNRLRHPALPVVMDYFAAGDKQFLVMQFIPGKDLEQLLDERREHGQGAFMVSEVVQWADHLLDALEYLHAQDPPIIHRDIKPQNLKLTPRGEVILLDFGLAKGVITNLNKSGQSIRGYTPNYASLEQIRGTGTDARSDIYSLGATLYHLLTGVMPADAMTRMAAQMMGEADLLRPAVEVNLSVPEPLSKVIEQAMAQLPEHRFANASVMRQALRNACRNIPVTSLHRAPTLTDEWTPNVVSPVKSDDELDSLIILIEDTASSQDSADQSDEKFEAAVVQTPAANENNVKRKSRSAWYAVAALTLMVMTAVLMIYRDLKPKPELLAGAAEMVGLTRPETRETNLNVPMRLEILSYYLEVLSADSVTSRATGMIPISTDSRFKFHFKPMQSGYIYLIALGKNGRLQTFLTEIPMPETGAITNWSAGGNDYQFPDSGQWFMLPKEAESAPFTIIFSPEALKSPAFLSLPSGHELNETELQELTELRKRSSAISPNLVAFVEDNQPAVAVQALADRYKNEPLVFDITINKK